MSYGNKYSCVFNDLYDREIDFKIKQRSYSGEVTNITLTGTPLIYYKNARDIEVFSFIQGSVLEINIRCTSAGQYDELFTSDANKYQVILTIASTITWVGYIKPNTLSRDVQNIYEMSIEATDRLGDLKNIEFKNGDDFYDGYVSLYTVLYHSLCEIDDTPTIRDAIDVYPGGNDSESTLTQTYIYYRWFKESNTKAITCWEAIEEILKILLCRLYYYNGGWNIVPCDLSGDYSLRILDGVDGTEINEQNMEPNISITGATAAKADRNVYINKSQRLEILPAYKKITVTHDYGLNNNLFDPDEQEDFIRHLPVDIHGYILNLLRRSYNTDTKELKIEYFGNPTYPANDSWYIEYTCCIMKNDKNIINVSINVSEVVFQLTYGIFIYLQHANGTKYYLKSDGSWTTDFTQISSKKNTPATIDVTSMLQPIAGTLKIRFVIYEDRLIGGEQLPAYIVVNVGNSYIKLSNASEDLEKQNSVTIEGDQNNSYVPDDYKVKLGDLPNFDNANLIYDNGLFTYDDGDYIPTIGWTGPEFGGELIKWIANRIMNIYAVARFKLIGQCLSHFIVYHNPKTLTRVFMIGDSEYDIKRSIWSSTLLEIAEDPGHILLETGDDLLLEDGSYLIKE